MLNVNIPARGGVFYCVQRKTFAGALSHELLRRAQRLHENMLYRNKSDARNKGNLVSAIRC
jgi:hypothetical protein